MNCSRPRLLKVKKMYCNMIFFLNTAQHIEKISAPNLNMFWLKTSPLSSYMKLLSMVMAK